MRRYLSGKIRPIPPKILGLFLLVLVLSAVAWIIMAQRQKSPIVENFDECVKAGGPILESYPEQCAYNGRTFFKPGQEPPAPF
jgi:hypothetical protein